MAAAAAQPAGEGGYPSTSPTFRAKSFSKLFASSSQQRVHMSATHSTHRGEPAITFSHADIEAIVQPFQFALVGKFARSRPRMEDIRKFFLTLDLKESFSVGLMDSRHVLICLHNEADFLQVWTRNVWYVFGSPMRVFKWTSFFHVDRESSPVLVWFGLPKLPVHLFEKQCLFQIVSCLGRPLFIDSATAAMTRPSVARVCIEVDLLKELPPRVWIQVGEGHGFWQPLIPENLPKYYGHCYRQGHYQSECRIKHPELRQSGEGKVRARVRLAPQPLGEGHAQGVGDAGGQAADLCATGGGSRHDLIGGAQSGSADERVEAGEETGANSKEPGQGRTAASDASNMEFVKEGVAQHQENVEQEVFIAASALVETAV
ncbi:uncharacterized protein LOC113782422 [Coffea eugenioides]|uniref:uncharacterized protein LOC113782422 n=1 Tax=Coffea eugenioides TaxID=49369 RepID=UPI000F60BB3F|nr:uncharacterized protein LOC113782422 [Coffea eugenioides]